MEEVDTAADAIVEEAAIMNTYLADIAFGEDEEDVADGPGDDIQRSCLLHTRRQLNEQPEEEEEEVADGPNNCNQWRRQLVGIELVGCLHSFSSGLHEVRHPYPC